MNSCFLLQECWREHTASGWDWVDEGADSHLRAVDRTQGPGHHKSHSRSSETSRKVWDSAQLHRVEDQAEWCQERSKIAIILVDALVFSRVHPSATYISDKQKVTFLLQSWFKFLQSLTLQILLFRYHWKGSNKYKM